MVRGRVLSFISTWGGGTPRSTPPSSTPASPTLAPADEKRQSLNFSAPQHARSATQDSIVTPTSSQPATPRRATTSSRRDSMVQTYQPPVMQIEHDTPPELQPIFSYLNAHAVKLYQEGYFLKLHDLDSRGRPSQDRVWNECFAQLVGTVLSLWDAAQLDAAGDDGEVTPTFINLTDASIKMIESLPMNGVNGQSLNNVLSVSTAANNRYLLHFNSLHSLTQWTAGIRLAMYEHSTLQEAYTGSILAAKGKHLNGIREIMERCRFPTEDWARVRFGAGTPWRRLWCVIRPADEKEIQKAQKEAKKRSAYDRSRLVVKGDIKFYETRNIKKKTEPIATITDAYAAYAIYPQSKPLIDQSTLIKIEGTIRIHSQPQTTTEGFVFVMPEVHAAVTGFETMLRYMLPTYDTFCLYGRPERLVANVLDVRSLMFAMPKSKRYGYLELIDVAGLIHTEGSQNWSEKEWRKQLKNLTSKRMNSGPTNPGHSATNSISSRIGGSRSSLNLSLPGNRAATFNGGRGGVRFGADSDVDSPASSRNHSPPGVPMRVDSAPPMASSLQSRHHQRAASDSNGKFMNGKRQPGPSRLSFEAADEDSQLAPPPPAHRSPAPAQMDKFHDVYEYPVGSNQSSPEQDGRRDPFGDEAQLLDYARRNSSQMPVTPVAQPPEFIHNARAKPQTRPNAMPDLRRANSTIDSATLEQMRDSNRQARARTNSGAYDDMHAQYAPGTSVIAPGGNPNYQYNGNAYSSPQYRPMDGGAYSNGYVDNYQYQHRPAPPAPPAHRPVPSHQAHGPPSQQWGQYMQQRRGPPAPDQHRLPTIPGTPAFEHGNQFDLAVSKQRSPERPVSELRSSTGSIPRKPVPGRQNGA